MDRGSSLDKVAASEGSSTLVAYQNLRPTQVYLDPENPRLPDGTSSDREAINRLLDEGAEALISLARNMAETGQSNPAELPIAIKDGARYLIIEGNRRFAALKLLKDPGLAEYEVHQRAFQRAAALGTPPRTVHTLVIGSREEADRWIVLRHTGENGGVGVKRWSAQQVATHRRRANKTVDSGTIRSITIADDLEEAYATDQELVNLVRRVRREKLTNIGRLFSNDVLTPLHLSIVQDAEGIRDRVLMARHSAEQLHDFFRWAFEFLSEKSVDAYKNPKIRAVELAKIRELLPDIALGYPQPVRLTGQPYRPGHFTSDETTPEGTPEEEDDKAPSNGSTTLRSGGDESAPNFGSTPPSSESGTGGPTAVATTGRRSTEPRPPQYLFQGLTLPNHPQRVRDLLRECKKIEMTVFPGIACILARVLVELSVSHPDALRLSGARESSSLKEKIVSMLKHLDPNIEHARRRDKSLEQAYLEVTALGMEYLNGFVHNPQLHPDGVLALRFMNAFKPFLLRIDGVI